MPFAADYDVLLILDFLSRFTAWRPYEHRVLARIGDKLLPIPVNRTTINLLYGLDLDPRGSRTSSIACACRASGS